jgi:gliding motility-associated-like protein
VKKSSITAMADKKTRLYGDENPMLSISYSGLLNNKDTSLIDEPPSISTDARITSNFGTYPIILTGGSDNNYDIMLINGNLEVVKATLTITADDKTKVYGQNNPVLTVTYSGFVLGQNQSFLDVLPIPETMADMNSDAGKYDITISGTADTNYCFIYKKGTLNINKADQTISFSEIPARLRMTQKHQLIVAASSGLQVDFESSDPNTCSINGNILTVLKDGNVTITAKQGGDHNWNPAADVSKMIVTLPTFDNVSSLFTPNNDGMNDYWYITDLEQYGKLQVTIYNRFGQPVYRSDSYKNDWDGTWNGYPLPSASYYYIINSSKKGFIKGVVNIYR